MLGNPTLLMSASQFDQGVQTGTASDFNRSAWADNGAGEAAHQNAQVFRMLYFPA